MLEVQDAIDEAAVQIGRITADQTGARGDAAQVRRFRGGANRVCHQIGGGAQKWTQQLGATMSVFDAGIAALKAASDPKDKAAIAAALSTLNVVVMLGRVDFTAGPVPNVSGTPIIGSQWITSESDKWTDETVITGNATDPNVPVSHKLVSYDG